VAVVSAGDPTIRAPPAAAAAQRGPPADKPAAISKGRSPTS